MERQFTGKIKDDERKEFQQALEGALAIEGVTQITLGRQVGMLQPAVSQVINGKPIMWNRKREDLFVLAKEMAEKAKEEAEKGATAVLQKQCARYLEIGGGEKVLGGILALLTAEQERHQDSNAKSTKKAKSRKVASSTR